MKLLEITKSTEGLEEAKTFDEFKSLITNSSNITLIKGESVFHLHDIVQIASKNKASRDYGIYFDQIGMIKDIGMKVSGVRSILVKVFEDNREVKISEKDLSLINLNTLGY